VVTLVLASCQDLHGVAVIVQPGDPAVTSVRLFIGTGGATSSSLTTSANVQVDDAAYWSRDLGNASDVVTGVDGTGEVRFVFDTSDAIPVVIAVGYDANKMPIAAGAMTDLELRDGGFTGYALPLTGPVMPLGTQGSPLQLGLWSPDRSTSAYDAACAGIVVAGADHPYFVVTDQDQDCDGLADDNALECAPDVYLGTRAADPSEISCLSSIQAGLGTPDCKLGGATCTDNVPRDQNMCSPSHICALGQLCTVCGSSYACAADTEAHLAEVDHYECNLARKSDNTVCQTTFTLARPPTGGYGCTGFAIGDDNTPLGTKLQVGNVELDASVHDSSASSCAGTLAAQGSASMPVDFTGLVTFTLKNNAGIAMPIHFSSSVTTTGCPQTAECALVAADTFKPPLTACAAAWDAPTAIGNIVAPTGDASGPSLRADQLEMFYTTGGTIYRTTRTAIGAQWTPALPVAFSAFATTDTQRAHAPQLAPDGVEMFFTVIDTSDGATRLYYVTRSSNTSVVWNTPAPVDYPAAGFAVISAAWGPGNQVFVGTASMQNLQTEIYDTTFDLAGKALSAFVDVGPGIDPFVTADGMDLYFAGQDVPDGTGPLILKVASRRTPTDTFAPPVSLPELSGAANVVTSPWVPSGARRIYFSSQTTSVTLPALFESQRTSF